MSLSILQKQPVGKRAQNHSFYISDLKATFVSKALSESLAYFTAS